MTDRRPLEPKGAMGNKQSNSSHHHRQGSFVAGVERRATSEPSAFVALVVNYPQGSVDKADSMAGSEDESTSSAGRDSWDASSATNKSARAKVQRAPSAQPHLIRHEDQANLGQSPEDSDLTDVELDDVDSEQEVAAHAGRTAGHHGIPPNALTHGRSGRPYLVVKDEKGNPFPTHGVLIPEGWTRYMEHDWQMICPVRTCQFCFLSFKHLAPHFMGAHAGLLFNDNEDGTLSVLLRWSIKSHSKDRPQSFITRQGPWAGGVGPRAKPKRFETRFVCMPEKALIGPMDLLYQPPVQVRPEKRAFQPRCAPRPLARRRRQDAGQKRVAYLDKACAACKARKRKCKHRRVTPETHADGLEAYMVDKVMIDLTASRTPSPAPKPESKSEVEPEPEPTSVVQFHAKIREELEGLRQNFDHLNHMLGVHATMVPWEMMHHGPHYPAYPHGMSRHQQPDFHYGSSSMYPSSLASQSHSGHPMQHGPGPWLQLAHMYHGPHAPTSRSGGYDAQAEGPRVGDLKDENGCL